MSNYVTNSHYLDIIDSIAEQMNQSEIIFTHINDYFNNDDYSLDAAVNLMKKFKDNENIIGYSTANLIYMLSTNQRIDLADSVKRKLVYKNNDNEIIINGNTYILTFLEVDLHIRDMAAIYQIDLITFNEAGEKILKREKDLDVDYALLRNYPKSAKMAQHALKARYDPDFDFVAYIASQELLPNVGITKRK